jgi:hypothetical protein
LRHLAAEIVVKMVDAIEDSEKALRAEVATS